MSTDADGAPAKGWGHKQRAERALVRQLKNQQRKARGVAGHEAQVSAFRQQATRRVRALLEAHHSLSEEARILEVGSGAHGLIFFWGTAHGIGVDPLALQYAALFPAWQHTPTATAFGESLPFPDGCFDVVLTDNVVDHAERPAAILAEIARVLKPSGVLYFSVNIHHPLYRVAAAVHSGWRALGLPLEIRPFAAHTYHFTRGTARHLFQGQPLRILYEASNVAETQTAARQTPPRHPGDLLKRLFFKNARYEVIATRDSPGVASASATQKGGSSEPAPVASSVAEA